MPTPYAQLPAGTDRNIPRVTDADMAEAAARHLEAVDRRPYASPLPGLVHRSRTASKGGTR
ncbi:hypothetical protein JNW88_00145 [Micromonospora sp. ATA32]|nr:hypothetical protein [Micromonospora sp. ATA32]